jgi:hypothetical protein
VTHDRFAEHLASLGIERRVQRQRAVPAVLLSFQTVTVN